MNNLTAVKHLKLMIPNMLLLVNILLILLIFIKTDTLSSSLMISVINLTLITYVLFTKYFEHIMFKIYYAYHLLTLQLPFLVAILLYSESDVLLFITKFGINEEDMLIGNIIILIYDCIVILMVLLFNKIHLIKKRKYKIFRYYYSNSNKYILILVIAIISYSMKLYLMSIGAWFMFEEVDLSKYTFANTAEILQQLDIFLLLYITYNYKYDKSKTMLILMLTIIIFSLFFAIISTSKAKLFMVLIPVTLLIMQLKYKKIYLTILILFFISSGSVFNYFMYLRMHTEQSLTTNTIDFLSTKSQEKEKDIFDNLLLKRLGYQFTLARAIKVYDNDNHKYKVDYFNNIIGLIPRFIWLDKPIIGIDGNKIGYELGLLHKSNINTSIGITPIGEAFYELGYLGIFIIPIFTALILYFFTQILYEGYWIGFLMSIMLGLLIAVSDWYNPLIPTLIKTFFIFYLFGFLLNKKYTDEIRLKFKW